MHTHTERERERGREGEREGGRGRESERERGREGGRESEREGWRERGKEREREGRGREGGRERSNLSNIVEIPVRRSLLAGNLSCLVQHRVKVELGLQKSQSSITKRFSTAHMCKGEHT